MSRLVVAPRIIMDGHLPILERIKARCEEDPATGCWIWRWSRNPSGYAQITVGKATRSVTRLQMAALTGRTLGRFDFVCHHCDNPPCVNPAHLYIGTPKDNNRDMVVRGRVRGANMTCCRHGHPYPDNVYWTKEGHRQCRECHRLAEGRRQKSEAGKAARREYRRTHPEWAKEQDRRNVERRRLRNLARQGVAA